MITLKDAIDQLDGYNSDEVAELMRLAGKQGVQHNFTQCPMACYFNDVTGRIGHSVGAIMVHRGPDVNRYSRMLPEGVIEFIRRFDRGEFEDLVIK